MIRHTLSDNKTLDEFVLAKELMSLAGLSPNAFCFWKRSYCGLYEGSAIVFIKKSTVPSGYLHLLPKCTALDGYVQSAAFCRYLGLSPSSLVESNGGEFVKQLQIKRIGRAVLVNLKAFYERLGLSMDYQIYVDKCKNFSPLEKKIRVTKSLCIGYY